MAEFKAERWYVQKCLRVFRKIQRLTREGFIDAESHGFSAAHQHHNRCRPLVAKSIAAALMALYVRHWMLLHPNYFRQEFSCQIPSDTATGFPQGRASNCCIAHRRHEQLSGVSVCCVEYLERISTAAADNRIDKLGAVSGTGGASWYADVVTHCWAGQLGAPEDPPCQWHS